MSPALVALLCLVALLVGVAVGVWAERPAAPLPAPLPPPPLPAPAAVAARLSSQALEAARAALGPEAHPASVDALAETLTALSAEAWSQGVTDLRASLVLRSGLPPEVADFAVGVALDSLEQRDA